MRDPSPSPPLRVLVVDDCEDNRESLALLLGTWGYQVCLARDGPSALEASREFRPHAVLLDIGLPGLNGWELGRRLREQEGTRRVLLVALTGHGTAQDRERSEHAGLDAHLTKPPDLQELQRLLADAHAWPAPAGAA